MGLVPRRDRLPRIVRMRCRLPGHGVSAPTDLPVDLRVRERLLVAGPPLQHLPVAVSSPSFFWRLVCLVLLRAAFLAFGFFFVDFAFVDLVAFGVWAAGVGGVLSPAAARSLPESRRAESRATSVRSMVPLVLHPS